MAAGDGATLWSELRIATRDRHDRIEAMLRIDAHIDIARYGRIVHAFHVFLAAWEPHLRGRLPERLHAWFDARCRGRLARDDLVHLGHLDPRDRGPRGAGCTGGVRAAPAAAPLAGLRIGTVAGAFGSMYVLEGSALGGQVLVPRLQAALGVAPGRGASYFHGFGARTGALWKEFRAVAFAEVGASAAAVAEACDAACRTFDALAACFEDAR